jgi:hypothetical protein
MDNKKEQVDSTIFLNTVVCLFHMSAKGTLTKKKGDAQRTHQSFHVEMSHHMAVQLAKVDKEFSTFFTENGLTSMLCLNMAF